ncbi:MAG: energy transducer TonB [Treponema sp.]|nr:energy transducer TonB [Treponema sp.]
MNEPNLRFAVVVITIFIHLVVLVFVVFETEIITQERTEEPRIISLHDINELIHINIPVQPRIQSVQIPDTDIPRVEAIAEAMIESDDVPEQEIVEGGTLREHTEAVHYVTTPSPAAEEIYLPIVRVTVSPDLDNEIVRISGDINYPQIALRSGMEGRVILELFIDRTGIIRSVDIRLEDPQGNGFGEAAAAAFRNKRVTPATSNGEPVSFRMNFPFRFQIRR